MVLPSPSVQPIQDAPTQGVNDLPKKEPTPPEVPAPKGGPAIITSGDVRDPAESLTENVGSSMMSRTIAQMTALSAMFVPTDGCRFNKLCAVTPIDEESSPLPIMTSGEGRGPAPQQDQTPLTENAGPVVISHTTENSVPSGITTSKMGWWTRQFVPKQERNPATGAEQEIPSFLGCGLAIMGSEDPAVEDSMVQPEMSPTVVQSVSTQRSKPNKRWWSRMRRARKANKEEISPEQSGQPAPLQNGEIASAVNLGQVATSHTIEKSADTQKSKPKKRFWFRKRGAHKSDTSKHKFCGKRKGLLQRKSQINTNQPTNFNETAVAVTTTAAPGVEHDSPCQIGVNDLSVTLRQMDAALLEASVDLLSSVMDTETTNKQVVAAEQ